MKILNILKRSSIKYTCLAALASGINFFTLIIFGRIFSVKEYGAITTMQAMVANVAVLMTPLQIMMCKTIADAKFEKKVFDTIVSLVVTINGMLLLLLLVIMHYMSSYLHFSNVMEYITFVALVIANNIYIVLSGVVQGKQKFVLLGLAGVILYGAKLLISVLLELRGLGLIAAIVGFFSAELMCIVVICVNMYEVLKDSGFKYRFYLDLKTIKMFFATILLYVVVSFYMNNGDLILGNIYINQTRIGLYSVAINLAKISVFLIATPIATIILPKVVAYGEDKKKQKRTLLMAEGITLVVSLAYGVFFVLFKDIIIKKLYGPTYYNATRYVFNCVLFSTILGVFWVFYQYAFATDLMKIFTIVALAMGLLEVIIILITQMPLEMIPVLMSVGMILTMVIAFGMKNSTNLRKKD